MPGKELSSTLLLVAITVIWGLTFAVIKDVLRFVSPIYFIFWRFLIATVVVYAVFARKIHADRGRSLVPGMIVGLSVFVGFVTQTVGLKETTANKSAFITSMYVIMVPFLSHLLERKPVARRALGGSVLACLGLYILARPDFAGVNVGDVLTLICALAFGFQIVLTNIYSKTYEGSALLFYELLLTAVLCFPASLVWGGWNINLNRQVVVSIIYVAVLATAFNIYIQNTFQKFVTSVKAAIIYTTEPIFAAVFAFLLIRELPTWSLLIGGGLIIAGLFVSAVGRRASPC